MKHVKFKTSEDNYGYLKEVIGFENLETYLNTKIESDRAKSNWNNNYDKN